MLRIKHTYGIFLIALILPFIGKTAEDVLLDASFSFTYQNCDIGTVTVAFQDESTTSGIASWLWELSDGQTSSQQNPVFSFVTSQILGVRLSITTTDGVVETSTQTLDIQVIENVFIRENLLLCPGGALPLNPDGNANYQYAWAPAVGLSDASAANPLAAPSQTTTYSVTITNTAGAGTCEVVKQVEIFVPPAIPLGFTQDFATCETTATLTVDTDPALDINWYDSEGNLIGKGLDVTIVPKGREVFFVEVIDEFGCSAKETVTVDQVEPPVLEVTPTNPPCGPGNLGSATAIAIGGKGPYIFEWSNGLSGPINANLPQGSYSVTLTDANNCTAEAATSIVESPTLVVNPLVNNPTCGGECTGSISPQISGGSGLFTIEWSDGSVERDRINLCAGNYSFILTDASGCSATSAVEIIEPTPIELSVTSPPGTNCGEPGTGILIANATGGEGILDFNWQDGTIGDTLSNLQPGSYMVTVTDENGCKATATGIIGPPTDLSTAIIANFDPCATGSIEVDLFIDPLLANIVSYEWMINGNLFTQSNPGVQVNSGDMIDVSVKVSTDEGCEATDQKIFDIEGFEAPDLKDTSLCQGGLLALNPTGNPGYIYIWGPLDGISDPFIANPILTATESTDYTLIVSKGECIAMDTISVEVLSVPTLEATGDTSLCAPSSVMLAADTDLPDKLVWSLNPDFSDTLSTEPELVVTPEGTQNYYVQVQGENGCVASDVVSVKLDSIAIPAEATQRVCMGQSTQITAIAEPLAQGLRFSWSPANLITLGDTTCCPVVTATEDVELTAIITNEATGCTSELLVNLVVDDVQTGEAIADPPRVYSGESSQLNVENSDPTLNYIWEPSSSLNNANIQNPVATPSETTTYTVSIESPTEQCASTRTVTVNVIACGEPFIFFPNAFSPNGDGENDMLFLRANNIDNSRFVIYSRWGERIFESNSLSLGWDGRFEGELVNPDVYGYSLEVTCANGEVFNKQGNVTVFK